MEAFISIRYNLWSWKYYQPARYGQFRIDNKGELLSAGMYDKDLKKLEPNEKRIFHHHDGDQGLWKICLQTK